MQVFPVFEVGEFVDPDKERYFVVKVVAATELEFRLCFTGLSYNQVLQDILKAMIPLQSLDMYLMEACDGSDIKPNPLHVMHLKRFLEKYHGRLSLEILELFDGFRTGALL